MQLSELEKKILQSLYDMYQAQPEEMPDNPEYVLLDIILGAGDNNPTKEEKEAYRDLVKKKLLSSFDHEPDEEHPNRYVMSYSLSVLLQYPDIIAGKDLRPIGLRKENQD